MAFGKTSLGRLPRRVLDRFKDNREDKVVHMTEVKMLKVLSPDTPLGAEALLTATEEAMASPTARTCAKCKETKDDVGLSLTGTCSTCWAEANARSRATTP